MTVALSIEMVAKMFPNDQLIFANGGDRSDKERVPGAESEICNRLGIEQRFGIGGEDKPQSSSNINKALGHEA
jgi:hypothetical protein